MSDPFGTAERPTWAVYWRSAILGTEAPVILQEISGLLDSPDVRTGDLTLLQRDGQVPGVDFLGGRTIAATVLVFDEDRDQFAGHIAGLVGALTSGGVEDQLRVEIPGVGNGWVQLSARVRKRSVKLNQDFYGGMATVDIEWFATDPRLYAVAEQIAETTPPLPSDVGMVFDVAFDLRFTWPTSFGPAAATLDASGTVITRSVTANTAGSTSTSPIIEVHGPATSIVVSVPAQQKRLEIRDGYTLPAGTFLRFDMRARTVAWCTNPDDPGQSVFHLLTPGSTFFNLLPGNNTVILSAIAPLTVDAPTVKMRVRWRDAWV